MKLFSINCWIHYLCFTPSNKQERFDKIIHFIDSLQPEIDVVCCQELFSLFVCNHKLKQVLSKSTKFHENVENVKTRCNNYKHLLGVYQDGGCKSFFNTSSGLTITELHFEVFEASSLLDKINNKGFLISYLSLCEGCKEEQILLINTHLDANSSDCRLRQCKQIVDFILKCLKLSNEQNRFIVVGDFNVENEAEYTNMFAIFQQLSPNSLNEITFEPISKPTHINGSSYDKVITNMLVESLEIVEIAEGVSDHFGLLISLQ